jgi:adenosylhomocysteine nucleosidase
LSIGQTSRSQTNGGGIQPPRKLRSAFVVGRAILPAAAFQAAFSGRERIFAGQRPAESRLQPGLAAPQFGRDCLQDQKVCGIMLPACLMRILMVAADRREFPGILAHSTGVSPAHLGVAWSRSARLANHQLVLAANGAGAQRAASAVEAALQAFSAEAIVSTGFCGALAPELQIADIVVGSAISAGSRIFPALYPACARLHQIGVVCSIEHVAQTAAEKRELRSSGGSVVEMEAAGVADRAAARGVPFYCVRVVTDLAGEDMANDFNRALRPDGHFATMSILRDTLRKPLVRLPELLRLRNRSVRAARVLGDFIADCRF